VFWGANSNGETDTASVMYLNTNKKNYLTNVLLFARRCNKFVFWPCKCSEFPMIHPVYLICYSVAVNSQKKLGGQEGCWELLAKKRELFFQAPM
jgi:hypothetical protein